MVCECGHWGRAAHGDELGVCKGTSRIVNGKREFYPCEKNCQEFQKRIQNGKIQNRPELVLAFLQECENNCWELDGDDISHVLSLDFDYVRKQEELISEQETQESQTGGTSL